MSAGADAVLIYAFAIGAIAALVALYFLPTLIVRNKQHANAIKRLNLYLGWTVVGWIAALVWAIMSPQKEVIAVAKNCPICETEKHMGHKAETLYGHLVCRKCFVAFANRRQLAFVIDTILWEIGGVLIIFVGGFVLAIGGSSDLQIEVAARIMQWVLWPTFFLKDGFRGHSPGKAMMGVQVVHATSGEPGGFLVSFKRNLPLAIPFMPLVVAVQLYKGHRWGDGWSESRVIWEKQRNKAPFAIGTVSQ